MQTFPHPPTYISPTYISEEEIRKYSQNPGKHPPKFQSGEKW